MAYTNYGNRNLEPGQVPRRPATPPMSMSDFAESIVDGVPDRNPLEMPPEQIIPTQMAQTSDTTSQIPISPMMGPLMGDQPPLTVESTLYVPGYLNTQIGATMRVEFLIGSTGPTVDRIGTLLKVGISYILIRPVGTDDTLLCDMYSIKFVTIYDKPLSC